MRNGIALAIAGALLTVTPALAEEGTQSWLTPVTGSGSGRVIVSPTAQEADGFYAQGEVEIEAAPASTTMAVTRALYSDGSCSTMSKPWTPVSPGSLTTDADGAGSMHFVRDTPNPIGSTFYTIFRVAGGGTLLQSDCIAVYVK